MHRLIISAIVAALAVGTGCAPLTITSAALSLLAWDSAANEPFVPDNVEGALDAGLPDDSAVGGL